jgi:TonB family protein
MIRSGFCDRKRSAEMRLLWLICLGSLFSSTLIHIGLLVFGRLPDWQANSLLAEPEDYIEIVVVEPPVEEIPEVIPESEPQEVAPEPPPPALVQPEIAAMPLVQEPVNVQEPLPQEPIAEQPEQPEQPLPPNFDNLLQDIVPATSVESSSVPVNVAPTAPDQTFNPANLIRVLRPPAPPTSPKPPTTSAPPKPSTPARQGNDRGGVVCRNCPKPNYPRSARKDGIEGQPKVSFDVDANGKPTNIRIRNSSGNAELDQAAIEAVQKWQLDPNSSSNAQGVSATINFELEGSQRQRQRREQEREQRRRRQEQKEREPVATPTQPAPASTEVAPETPEINENEAIEATQPSPSDNNNIETQTQPALEDNAQPAPTAESSPAVNEAPATIAPPPAAPLTVSEPVAPAPATPPTPAESSE